MHRLDRSQILPEPELPAAADLLAEGRRLARAVTVGPSPFLSAYFQLMAGGETYHLRVELMI